MIPQSRMAQDYGVGEKGYRQLRRVVQNNDVTIKVRSRSAGALKRVEVDGAQPKPAPIKIKSAGELDTYIGVDPDDLDYVPWKASRDQWIPPDPHRAPANWPADRVWDDDAYDMVMGRYRQRITEFGDNEKTIGALVESNQARLVDGRVE